GDVHRPAAEDRRGHRRAGADRGAVAVKLQWRNFSLIHAARAPALDRQELKQGIAILAVRGQPHDLDVRLGQFQVAVQSVGMIGADLVQHDSTDFGELGSTDFDELSRAELAEVSRAELVEVKSHPCTARGAEGRSSANTSVLPLAPLIGLSTWPIQS